MNNLAKLLLTLMSVTISSVLFAQKNEDPQGALIYCLPSTTVSLEVTAVQENFHAGPYAKYAEKYLGVKARTADNSTFRITEIKMTPYVEADQNCRYSVLVKKGTLNPSVFSLSAAGLVTFADAKFADETVWRFPVKSDGDFSGKGISSNLTSEATTLYRNEKKESAYNRVSVQQNMVVEKSLEQKAAETAATILDLRRQRLQIVTGDTDATYSGEAMGAAIGELARLEQEYMTLFVGYSEFQTQKMRFDVVPEAARENQMYIAFRISDKSGLVPADDMTGRPVVMEIQTQAFEKVQAGGQKGEVVHYRIPAVCTVKIKNGADLLLQSRVPVYQLGQESSLPVAVAVVNK